MGFYNTAEEKGEEEVGRGEDSTREKKVIDGYTDGGGSLRKRKSAEVTKDEKAATSTGDQTDKP